MPCLKNLDICKASCCKVIHVGVGYLVRKGQEGEE